MTQNQINFAKLREEQRHNLATEKYTGIELGETKRHNVEQESLNWYTAQETGRHNVVSESVIPSQIGLNEAKTGEAEAHGELMSTQGSIVIDQFELDQAKLRLEEDILKQRQWRDARDVANEEEKNRIAARNADITADRLEAEMAKWEREYNLTSEKWKTEKRKLLSEVRKNYIDSYTKLHQVANDALERMKGIMIQPDITTGENLVIFGRASGGRNIQRKQNVWRDSQQVLK